MISKQNLNTMPARTSPGKISAVLIIANQDNNVKMVTDEQNKINTRRKNTYIGTWNVRTLREEGKLEELTHELDKYRWTVVGLSKVSRKVVNKIQTTEGHKLYYIGNDNTHINGVGFLINSEVTRMVMCFTPINDRIAIIRLHATPFNISIIQVYAPTTDHTDEEMKYSTMNCKIQSQKFQRKI